MAYDETLAERVRGAFPAGVAIEEKRMFGGLGYFVAGNMCCIVGRNGLIVRVGPDAYEDALSRPHARVFDMTGRVMTGFVTVDPPGRATDADLAQWLALGVAFAKSLPAK